MDEDAEDRFFSSDFFQFVLDSMTDIEEQTETWIVAVGLPSFEWHFFPPNSGINMFDAFANRIVEGGVGISVT